MMLNEKQYSRNTLNLAFDTHWKAGIYCGTTANSFSRTVMQHL